MGDNLSSSTSKRKFEEDFVEQNSAPINEREFKMFSNKFKKVAKTDIVDSEIPMELTSGENSEEFVKTKKTRVPQSKLFHQITGSFSYQKSKELSLGPTLRCRANFLLLNSIILTTTVQYEIFF